MAHNDNIEANKAPRHEASARPSEHLQHTVSDFLRGIGQEGSAKAVDAFSVMSQKLLSNKAVGDIFGNLSIVDKQGNAVAPRAAGVEQSRPAAGDAHAQHALNYHGDADGESLQDFAHAHIQPPESLNQKMAKLKAAESLPGTENTPTAQQLNRTMLPSERKRSMVRTEKNGSTEKSKAKQSKGKHEVSLTHDGKLEKTTGERGSSKTVKQPEQQAHRAQQQPHKTEPKAHTPERGTHAHTHRQEQQNHEETVKRPEQPVQHDHEITAKHQESSARHDPETTAKHPKPEAQNNREATTKHSEPARKNDHEVAIKEQKPIAHHDKTANDRTNNKQNTEPPKEIITARKLDRPVSIEQSDKITAAKLPDKPIASARIQESRAAQHASTPPPIKTPESVAERQMKAEIAHKQAPPLSPKQETTEKVIKQSQQLAASNEKGADKSGESVSAKHNQPVSKQLTEEKTLLGKKEPDNERGSADKPDNTVALAPRDNNIADWAEVNHNNAEYLTRQDHAPGASHQDTGSPVHNHSTSDLSHNALAKSTHPASNHIESSSKIHNINHIVSSMKGHSGKIDSVRIIPEPEVVNKNKNTPGGTPTSSATGTTASGSAHTSPDHHGHSGHHSDPGHGPGNKQTTNPGSQNTGSGQAGTTDPGKSQTNPTGNAATPTNPSTPPKTPTTGYGGGPIIVEPLLNNREKQAAYLFELFAEIALMAGMDSHNNGRRLAIHSLPSDITNPAIPGNIFTIQPYTNQPGNPSNWHPVEPNVSQPNLPDTLSPIYSPAPPTQNPAAENNLGLNLDPVVSEPAGTTGTTNIQTPPGSNGNGFEAKGSPTANPALSDPGMGQFGINPAPNGSPYLSGSVDYWGGDPGSTSASPGVGPNANTPFFDDGSNNGSPISGQPNYSGHLEPETAQPGYAPLTGEISNESDGNNHDKEGAHHRPEIADPWQISHHLHEQGTTAHENQLDHKHGQPRHDLLANDPWQEQNHGRKHAHTQPGSQPHHNNDRLPGINTDILIGQLLGLLDDTKKNKDPKQQPSTYVVKAGDTLESIASDVLFDFRLGLLIYIINKTILPTQSDWRQCKLREGTVLFLPEEPEIRSFRMAMIEKEKQEGALISLPINDEMINENHDQEIIERLSKRRMNIERLLGSISHAVSSRGKSTAGREQVTVRLGDTLRSIALKHASLHDVSLWKLLAQLNELSCAIDAKGVPIAILTRGTILQLPTVIEIAEYRANQARSTRALSPRKALQAEILDELLSLA